MKKSLRLLSLSLVLVLIVATLAGCGAKTPTPEAAPAPEVTPAATEPAAVEPAAEAITFVFAEVNPLDTIVGQTDSAFKEKVEELSNGMIKIDIQPSGVLGSENDVLDTMLGGGGTIDMSRISAFALTSYGGEKSKLLSIPYTFANREHFWNFATSDLAPVFLLEPHENGSGVRGLFYGEEGFRHFFSAKPLNSMADLKGLKIRVSNDPVMNGMVEGLGASPTVVSFGELYSALQTGVVDAAEQPIANYKSNAFPEVAPNMILDGHTLGAIQVIITDEAWDSLTADQQAILTEAGKYASEFNRKISEDAENKVLEELKASGVTIVDVQDKAPWQDACKDIIEKSTADNAELYQQILDMK
ncbi:TRAP transporter substrate-binding protein [Fusibacter sp. 3D3]|uniref:TRAP transporter substrate-binding protein n=1 Tax=Fusibacter sp. 3D3 TaxID=1048380 RepID=UPI000852F562|nr:TRAP transporter substrate-binding protein [Fusibacter sp. 3D3]GAU75589.1 TRAP-type C4-dicarboxylate transport system, periplasmic component [Fusibacter sp. 3D3]